MYKGFLASDKPPPRPTYNDLRTNLRTLGGKAMAVKHRKWWKDMEPRRQMIRQKAHENDVEFMRTLGSMEQCSWHDYRKEVDPEHINPYSSDDRRRYFAAKAQ